VLQRVFKRAGQVGRPCLLGYIDKCSAPCVGRVTAEEHRHYVDDLVTFLSTDPGRFMRSLQSRMREASAAQEYERAAALRDDLRALERALERSAIVLPDDTEADVIAIVDDELEAAVQVFHVRAGRVRGQRGWVAEKVDDSGRAELVEQFLGHLYGTGPGAVGAEVPREVLVPSPPSDTATVTEWLSELRGARVDVRVPQRGDKHALLTTVTANATHALALHKIRRAGDLTTRSQALSELQDALELPEAPLRIECFDVSNLQGTEVVASMVVFEDGLPRKSEYRRFIIKQTHGQDDVAAMHEVITRRFKRYLEQPSGSPDDLDRPRTGFAYPPQLVVVDGGPPQVAAAQRAMTELGIVDIAVVGLAKRLEEVWLPETDEPVILSRTSQALYLLQRVRDEAHRFAITFHRKRRSAAMTTSALDRIAGLGEARRKALLARFGSLRKLRAASTDEIAAVPGIGPKTAAAIHEALRDDAATSPAQPAVNVTTGEVLE
jgi:excinuclease ABC subunit C